MIYARPNIRRGERLDGSILLKSAKPLGPHPTRLPSLLRGWATADPGWPVIAERAATGQWVRCSYGQALAAANSIGQALLDHELNATRPLMIVSGNSIGHLLMSLGALTVGIPVVPTSVAYSLQSPDHQRLRAIHHSVHPGMIYAEDLGAYRPALDALNTDAVLAARTGDTTVTLDALRATNPGPEVERAFGSITADTIAKILFTSGSTGEPKGVINTHGMLCANQRMIQHVWPFLARERPVLVDWLPWSHTFGGNHNLNLVLANGGTLYIDDGKPTAASFAQSLANYRDIAQTISFNVPAGYGRLVPELEQDPDLAAHFFSRLRLIFNASAALPSSLRHRLQQLAHATRGQDIPVTGSWGTTETAPAATSAHYDYTDARCIGVPLPGITLKLMPTEHHATFEIRVRGTTVSPGYYRRPDLDHAAFDHEGFYRTGDLVTLADPTDPNQGLLFAGRSAEGFKLATGTFVRVGELRSALLSAAPLLADAVIVGEGRDQVGALAWINPAEASTALDAMPQPTGQSIHTPRLAAVLGAVLARLNHHAGSATRIERLIILAHRPCLDAGEITDKNYLNQRRIRVTRAAIIEQLYADPPPASVITPQPTPE